jgi:glutamate formiminotransferase/formiminotetrahydrofolate cyclodeaminase
MVETLRPITNPNMSSDLTAATALARAALEGALANVEINLGSMKAETAGEEEFASEVRKRVDAVKETQ